MSRPTARPIFPRSCINSLNFDGLMDSSPSHSAHSGLECTSINNPSAPAATAAFDMGATNAHLPVAWLGSTMTGRWESSLRVGIAARSSVFRYCVSKVLMPRSQSITLRLPRDRSEEHTSELQSLTNLVCRLLLEKKNQTPIHHTKNKKTKKKKKTQ